MGPPKPTRAGGGEGLWRAMRAATRLWHGGCEGLGLAPRAVPPSLARSPRPAPQLLAGGGGEITINNARNNAGRVVRRGKRSQLRLGSGGVSVGRSLLAAPAVVVLGGGGVGTGARTRSGRHLCKRSFPRKMVPSLAPRSQPEMPPIHLTTPFLSDSLMPTCGTWGRRSEPTPLLPPGPLPPWPPSSPPRPRCLLRCRAPAWSGLALPGRCLCHAS